MDRDDRNTTGLYGDGRAPPYAMDREDREKLLLEKMTIPSSYAKNTTKEELCLAFVETFKAQYVALYPGRAPLLLSPLNECGRLKFISTFIRPTSLKFDELYDFESCAKYVANYIKYEPLDPPEVLPSKVMSPTTTLLWQIGNSIEVSILMCSLLLGAGYNAYCVVGYANREVTNNEQEKQNWPDKLQVEPDLDDNGSKVKEEETRYKEFLKKRPKLRSEYDDNYLHKVGDRKTNDGLDDNIPESYDQHHDDEDEEQKPVHAWVMLLPKKRKIQEPIFIEPSTGMTVQVKDPRYLGIEAVFNHQNYYVNLHPESPIAELKLDLRDLTAWEHVFLADPEMAAEDDPHEQERLRHEDLTADIGDSGDQTLDLPASWVAPLTLSRQQYENRYPGKRKVIQYADARVEYFADFSDPELRVREVRLHDDKSSVHQAEQIHTFYKNRQDKLRRRSTFPSLERAHAAPRETRDWFEPGRKRDQRVEGLLEHIYVPGQHRTMYFDWKARDDGLAKRVEFFFSEKDQNPRQIEEYYRGRDEDRLIYRSATYDAPKEATALGVHLTSTAAGTSSSQTEYRVPAKMTERFERNTAIAANDDVAERTFVKPQMAEGEIHVIYHYSKNCITRPYRIFPRNAEKEKDTAAGGGNREVNPKVVTMPYTEPPKESDLQEELRVLLLRERECFVEIRNKATEISKDLLTHLKEEQADPKPVLSVYDTLRNRPKETEAELEQMRAEELRKAESRKDYLAPYIANLDIAKSAKGDYTNIRLDHDQAKKVRDEALRDLKERLIQRGHIMQNRMDREREALNRKQTAHAKSLEAQDHTKEIEEFSQFSKEVAWRMKILDERLARHIEQASDKYAKLAQRLAEDPRLKVIYPH